MAVQTTGGLTQAMQTYYDKLFLTVEEDKLVYQQFAQKRPLPKYAGKDIQFFGYRPLAVLHPTSTLTEGASGTEQTVSARNVTAQIQEWGAFEKVSTLLSLTAIDPELKGLTQLNAQQAGNTIDLECSYEITRGGSWALRADDSGTYTKQSVVAGGASSVVFSCSPTYVGSQASDFWNGGFCQCWAGPNYGWAGRITDFTGGGTNCQFTVTPGAPNTWSTYDYIRAVHGSTVTSAVSLTTAAIIKGYTALLNNKAMPLSNGYFAGVISPYTQYDLLRDTTFSNAMSYSDLKALRKAEIGQWFGIKWFVTTQPIRENSAGAWDSLAGTGSIFSNHLLGKEAFGAIKLEERQRTYVCNTADKSDPLNRFRTIGWQDYFTAKSLNSNWVVNILSGASGVADV